jgi:hypothetical protein
VGTLRGTIANTASTLGVSTDPGGHHHDIGPVDGLGQQPVMTGWCVDHRHLVVVDAVEGLGEQPLGGGFDQLDLIEHLVFGQVEPVGGAGLGIGVDERGPLAAGRREGSQIDGRGRLADATLQRSHHDDHPSEHSDQPPNLLRRPQVAHPGPAP